MRSGDTKSCWFDAKKSKVKTFQIKGLEGPYRYHQLLGKLEHFFPCGLSEAIKRKFLTEKEAEKGVGGVRTLFFPKNLK